MRPVRSALRQLTNIRWRSIFADIAVAIGLIVLMTIIVSLCFDLPTLTQSILDPFERIGEWCYNTHHSQPELSIAGLIGIGLVVIGSVGWHYIIAKPKRKEQKMYAEHARYVAYIDTILNDPELTELWLQDGPSEQSHAERASNNPAS